MSTLSVIVSLLLLSALCQAIPLQEIIMPLKGEETKVAYRLPTIATPSHYKITLQPDLEKFTYTGSVEVAFKLTSDTKVLSLNSLDLEYDVKKISVKYEENKKQVVAQAESAKADTQTEFLNIQFKDALKKGLDYTLVIDEFKGILNDKLRGFYRSVYIDKDDKVKYIATTHFEPTGARLAFPCWDEPAFKATFQIIVKHKKQYHAISNMPEEKSEEIANGLKQTIFKVTPKMSTYLVAFVVSDYEKKQTKDEKFRVWTKPNAVNQVDYALGMGEKVLGELDKYTKIEYKTYIPKIDQISIKNFSAGAMENWGLVTYKESSLLYEENVTTTDRKQSIARVIAHEFAHQWFGNLVSPTWWTYIWLNEGFATYFQYYVMDKIEPDWRQMEVFVTDALQGSAFVTDANEKTRPMNHFAESPKDISSLFDAIAYQKAGSVIRMISHILTPEVFQAGLQSYLKANALRDANSDELFTHFQKAAVDSKKNHFGKDFDIAQFMKEWVDESGYPVIMVKRDGEKVKVTQKRFSFVEAKDVQWTVPLTFTTQDKLDFNDTIPTKWLKRGDKEVEISVGDAKKWVIFNVQQTGYYRVNYDDENWDRVTEYLKSKDFNKIHSLNRAQLIDDSLNLARAGELNYAKALSLLLYLNKESDYIPWTSTFRGLTFLDNMLATSQEYPTFQLFVKHLLEELIEKVTFSPKGNDTDTDKLLRVNMVRWSCKSGEKSCVETVEKSFKSWVEDNNKNPLDVDLKNEILCAAIRNVDEKTWNKTLESYKHIVEEADRKTYLKQLACTESQDILELFLRLSLEEKSDVNDFELVFNAVLSNSKGIDVALDFIVRHFKELKELYKDDEKGILDSCIQQLGSRITDEEQYGKFGPFVSKKSTNATTISIAMQNAGKNIEWTMLHRLEIEEWLKANEKQFVKASAATTTLAACLLVVTMLITRFY